MEYRNHFGVYGICYRDNKLLCIRKNKNSGPYSGYYDLPGGYLEISRRFYLLNVIIFIEEVIYEK